MLTGDKLETATCIAKSSMLVSRAQDIHIFKPVYNREESHLELNSFRRKTDCALVITGESLDVSDVTKFSPYNAELILDKSWRPKGFNQFEIIINELFLIHLNTYVIWSTAIRNIFTLTVWG